MVISMPGRLGARFRWFPRLAWGLAVLVAVTQASWQRTGISIANEITIQMVLKGMLFLVLGLVGLCRLVANRDRVKMTTIYFLSLLFFLWASISSFYSPIPYVTFITAASSVAIFCYLLSISGNTDRELMIRSLLVGLLFLMAASLAAYFWAPGLFAEKAGRIVRLRGVAGHPNALAQGSGTVLLILLLLYISKWRSGKRRHLILGGALTAVVILTLWATTGRAAMIGVALALLFVLSVEIFRQMKVLGLAALVIILTIGLTSSPWWLLPDLNWEETAATEFSRSGKTEEITTLTGRTEIWRAAWDLVADNMLTGYGYRAGEVLLVDWGFPVHTHNMYLELIFSLGLVGTLLFLVVGFWTLGVNLHGWYVCRDRVCRVRSALLLFTFIVGLTSRAAVGNTTILFVVFWSLVADTLNDNFFRPELRFNRKPIISVSEHRFQAL